MDKLIKMKLILIKSLLIIFCSILLYNSGIGLAQAANGAQGFSLDVRDADMRDVLSALAIKMDVNILLLDNTEQKINLQLKNVTPLAALELMIQSKGLAYLQQGNTIIIGNKDTLQQDFFNQMVLTRFDTFNIKTDIVKNMIAELGVPGVQSVLVESNPYIIWAQGTVAALTKVNELIMKVDVPEAKEKTFGEEKARFVYQLRYIVAADAAERLAKFGFKDLVTITTANDRYGHDLLVVCPKTIETEVKSALNTLDSPRSKTKAPVLTAKGTYAHQALNSARDLLSQVSGVSASSMNISRNLGARQEPIYVLWVEEAPDKIRVLKDLVEEMELEEITSQDDAGTNSSSGD